MYIDSCKSEWDIRYILIIFWFNLFICIFNQFICFLKLNQNFDKTCASAEKFKKCYKT